MSDRDSDFSIFQGIRVRFDTRIDISISITPIITKFGKQLHLEDLTKPSRCW